MADAVLRIKTVMDSSGVTGEISKIQSRLQGLKLPPNLGSKFEGSLKNIMNKYNEFQTLANKGVTTKGDFSKLNNSAKEVEASIRSLKKELNGITEEKLRVQVDNLPEVKALEKEIERLKKTYSELGNLGTNRIQGVFGEEQTKGIRELVGESKNLKPALEKAFDAIKTGNIDAGLKELDALEKTLNKINGAALTNFQKGNATRKSDIAKYIADARTELQQMSSGATEAKAKLEQLKTDRFNQMASGISAARVQLDNLGDSAAKSTREILNTARATQNMESQLSGLQTQANYFFGLQNMLQLFRRGLSDTIQTVRDLDKAMTDTAVVTDMTVSDLWAQLPDYTKLANKLGATTQGAYETMTLYYQQGLNKEETFEIGEETMKMARIAGLDYAQTTNMMTAALRGFNMELNQTSAKRVNDVYSELAAITASDTRELGLAMERTASIAHSANMDFGNTTAFLAQMIETTREAPENLGTAMKTIIARFQELKQNPYEISEVEGEEVDFNRVDKALKSIGVDLMDNRDKFRDLDDVFLDISSRWDGLSQTQQRYIATIAAGARQQSRFLAMVQNYDRLKELTDAAANSEGASDVQFSKTLDSMEAKLNKLNNAWDQFTMGITNNELIKKGTGALVKILDVVNKFETGVEHLGDKIGGVFGDIFKSITSFTGLLLGFKGLGKLTDIGIGMLGGMLGMGKGVGAGMFGGMSGMRQATNAAQAKAISSPIVAAINRLTEVVSKKPIETDADVKGVSRQEFQNRRGKLKEMSMEESYTPLTKNTKTAKTFYANQFKEVFNGLNQEQQAALYRGQKGTRQAIQKNFEESIKGLKFSDSAQKAAQRFYTDMDYAMANGSSTVQDGLTKILDPVKMGREIGGDAGKEIEKVALDRRKKIIQSGMNMGYSGKQLEKYWKGVENKLYNRGITLDEKQMKANTSNLANFTSTVNGAGSSLMQLGMTMQSLGFERLGGVISTVGSSLLSMGMMAETAAHAMSLLKIEASGLVAALPGIGIGLGLAAVAFGAAFAAYKIDQKHIKEIRKSGKEVVDTYAETTKSVQENLNKIDKIEPDWNKWAAGVDANGNNISLGSEEYQDYKNAVKDLTKMHPELIKGYNAEGEILVDNNTVLKEAIRLEKQRQKEATENYLKNGQKIIDRRNSTERWQKGQAQKVEGSQYTRAGGMRTFEKSQVQKDAQEAANAIKKVDGGEEVLKKWGVTFDELGNITEQGINAIRDHGGDMQNALVDAFSGTEITDAQQKLLDSSNDAIATLGKDFEGIEKTSQETFDALKTYATDKGILGNLDSDLIGPYQKTLKRIAEKDMSWGDMQNEVDALGKKYQNLGGHLQDFHEIQGEVEEAQKEFGKDLDMEAYKNKVDESTAEMDEWIEELSNSSNQADQILAEWFTTQKERLTNLSDSLPTLEDGFNTLAGEIDSANKAYENWSKRNEGGDYYTASDSFKKMYEEVNDGVDDLGKKSQSWWSAAEAMMGEDYIWDNSSKAVANHMKQVGRYFEEGKQGVDNFLVDIRDKFQNNLLEDGTKVSDYIKATSEGELEFNLDDISDEKFEQLAAAIGLSTDAFTALINKARQFYDIDFSNVEDMRAAIAAGGTAMIGNKTNKEGQQNLYMKESEFRNQLRASGVTDTKKIQEAEKNLSKAGTILMKDLKDISKESLSGYIKDWGLATGKNGNLNTTDAQSFIASLNKLQYEKADIQDAFQKNKDLITDADTADFEAIYSQIKAAEDPATDSVMSIQGTTEGILSAVNGIALSMGILTKEGGQQIDQGIEKAKDFDTDVTNYKNWSDYDKKRDEIESNLTATRYQLEAAKDKATNDTDKDAIQKKIDEINSVLKTIKDADLNKQEFREQQNLAAGKAVSEVGGATEKAYNDTAIGDNNKLDTNKLDVLIDSVRQNIEGKNNQDNVIGQYLQNSAKALVDNGADNKQIATSIQAAAQEMAQNKMKPADIASALNQGYGTHLTDKDITTTEQGKVQVNLDDQNLQEQLANLQADIKANLVIGGVSIGGASSKASGQNNPNSAFHRTGTMARGSRKGYTIPGRPTLMGEEGEEVVWEPKRNEAYIVGSYGPQFGNISRDAVVWNAQQTKKIKKNSKTTGALGTGARGITPIGTMKGGNAGGGGGLTIPGTFDINAMANVQEVTPPPEPPEIPVKGKLEVEGAEKGGLLNKIRGLMGGNKKGGPSIKVTAEATKINVGEQVKSVKVVGDITKLNNEAGNVKGIKATANVTKVTKSNNVAGEPIKVKASAVVSGKATGTAQTATVKTKADNTAQKSINNIKHSGTVLIKTKADNTAQRAINSIKGKDVTIHIKPSFEGTWTKNATVHVNHDAKGQNNYIAHRTAPSFGSAASGREGKLGPKGKGGLTLTGEKGFEIAWLPKENRSMILGAQGPQMLMLPSDAVVWDHEQSKKILKQRQTISAGSAGNTVGGTTKGLGKVVTTKTSTKSTKNGKKNKDKNKDKNDKAADKNNKNAASVIKQAGKISVWWENQARKVDGAQRKADKLLKQFEKELKLVGKTRYDISKDEKTGIEASRAAYEKQLRRTIKLNQQSEKKAKSELKSLDKKKTKRTISYEVTKKTKKGKTKKETKKGKVSLAGYISKDKVNDTYVINQKALNKVAKKNKSKAQAIKDLAEKEINDRLSKRNTAQDNITKAKEALEKLSNDIYEAFYRWEKSITEIYLLTQKLETITKKLSISSSQADLQFAKLEAGVTNSAEALPKIQAALAKERDNLLYQAQGREQYLKESLEEYEKSFDFSTYIKRYAANPSSSEAKNDYDAAYLAFGFLNEIKFDKNNFDYNKAIAELDKKRYNEETNNQIKSVLDKIFEKQGNYLDAISEAYDSQKEIYEKLEEYQDFIAGFETDLLSGIEEQTENEINRLDKLNSSLSNAFKDLIDEVKNKLDERRKAEDNVKTESDIAKKQQRLAALRADTAGGHAVEIAQLEKEIAEAQQSYQRNLEDQLLDRLQQQGDKAEKQRERQIQMLEMQKDIAKQTGTNLEQVKQWLLNPESEENKAQIKQAWLANKNYDEVTADEQKQLEEQFEVDWSKYLAYSSLIPDYEKIAAGTLNTLEDNTKSLPKLEESVDAIANYLLKINTTRAANVMRERGVSASQMKAVGISAKSLKEAGYTTKQIVDAGYKEDKLREAGITQKTIKDWNEKNPKNKIAAKTVRAAGFDAKEAGQAGFTDKEIRGGGYTAAEFKKYKGGAKGAKAAVAAGYSTNSVIKAYGATQGMTTLNKKGTTVQKLTGASAKTLQKIVNKNPKDNAKQSDMANVKVGTVDVNGKDKGGKVKGAHLSNKGTTVGVNKGSTLYTKGWDKNKGKVKSGKWTPITIDKLTTKLLKAYPIDAKQALISAIRNKKVGSKINKNFKSLITTAKLVGKTYKLKNGTTASVGSNGKIYYASGKKGVQIWDAAAGKLTLEKYNKKNFIKKYKNNKNVGREYKQVLHANKVKGYKTGGLADQTGPAWLDGTPSKPELVLNAADTQNFLALKDVLSKAVNSSDSVSNTYGDATFEININVDHISNDYDVDKIVTRVKKDITKSANYRNVTQVRNFR